MLESGIIVIWSGSIATIPTGFVICDGNNDTPDLRDRFLYGAGGVLNPGDTGGSLTHQHEFTSDGHSHEFQAGTGIQSGANFSTTVTTDADTGTTETGSSIPQYYALAFIMKT